MPDISDAEYLNLFRDAIKLLIRAHRSRSGGSPPDTDLHYCIGALLARVRRLKEERDANSLRRLKPEQCPHEQPERIRRIRGNGFHFIWRCPVCWTYFDPLWKEVDAFGNPKDMASSSDTSEQKKKARSEGRAFLTP